PLVTAMMMPTMMPASITSRKTIISAPSIDRPFSSFRNDRALRGVLVEIAEEGEAAGAERAYPHLALFARRNHFLDRRVVHFEFVGRVVQILDADEERLAGRHVNFSRREAMILQRDRIGRQVLGAGGADDGAGESHGADGGAKPMRHDHLLVG